jgi:hypothetical protein
MPITDGSIRVPPRIELEESVVNALTFDNGDYALVVTAPTNLVVGESGLFKVEVYDAGLLDVTNLCTVLWEFGDSYLVNIPPSPNEKFLFPETRSEDLCEDDIYMYTQELDPHHGKGGELVSYIWDATTGELVPWLTPSGLLYGNTARASFTSGVYNQIEVGTPAAEATGMYAIIENIWKVAGIQENAFTVVQPFFTHFTSMPANTPTKFYIYDNLVYQETPSITSQRTLLHCGYGIYNEKNGTFVDVSNTEIPETCEDKYLVTYVAYEITQVSGTKYVLGTNTITSLDAGLISSFWYNVSSGSNAISGGGTFASNTLTITGVNPYYFTDTGTGILRGLPIVLSGDTTSYYSLIDTNTENTITMMTTGMTGTSFNYQIFFKQQPIILMKQAELYDTELTVFSLYPIQNYIDLYGSCYMAFENGEIIEIIDVTSTGSNIYTITVVRQALFGDLYPLKKHTVGSFLHDVNFRGSRCVSGDTEASREFDNAFMMYDRVYKQNYVFAPYTLYDT